MELPLICPPRDQGRRRSRETSSARPISSMATYRSAGAASRAATHPRVSAAHCSPGRWRTNAGKGVWRLKSHREQALARLAAELQRGAASPALEPSSHSSPARNSSGNGKAAPTTSPSLREGFEWNGDTYRSLSAIARAITGTKWNGHVFFGLKPRHLPDSTTGPRGDHSAARASTVRHCERNDAHG